MKYMKSKADLPPLDVCGITVSCLLAMGTLQEIVAHQPDNVRAKEQLTEAQDILKKHLEKCKRCAKALAENENPN